MSHRFETFSKSLGTSNVNNLFVKMQTSGYSQKYQPVHIFNPDGTPRAPCFQSTF